MKLKTIITIGLAAAAILPAAGRSAKRGVSENQFQFKAQLEAIAPGVSWYYNWGPQVGRYLANETQMEFVPMCWNANYDAQAIRTYCGSHPEVEWLLGFNEPNFTNQANMTPAAAAAAWPGVRALAQELGLKLVAPALNYSPNPPYQNPVQWMDEFVALVGTDAFDALAVHSYGGFEVMKTLAKTFHEKYGKPVWVTEFCYWPEEGNPNSHVAPEAQISVMMQSVEWLEKTEWIERYAWFKAIGNSDTYPGPNYGLLISGKGENPRELSEQGLVYENLPEFDVNEYHPVGTWLPAARYISQKGCLLGSYTGENGHNPLPVEITRFNGGATIDYQFEVTEQGGYELVLNVAGEGEPKRFDPVVSVCAVNADGSDGPELSAERTVTLPGSYETYTDVKFGMTLQTGRQTLRIKDANGGRPNGMHIAAVKLERGSGIDGVAADGTEGPVRVWSVDGVQVAEAATYAEAISGLSRGLYIVNGRKIRL